MQWTPEALAEQAEGRLVRRAARPIAGAFIDSRRPLSCGVFVPIVAARDGHAFIPDAIAGGAAAILVARGREVPAAEVTVVEVDDPQAALTRLARRRREAFAGPVVSVSGSNGKTTTRSMIAAVVATAGPVLTTRGNYNNHLGVPLTLLGEPHEPYAMVLELGMSAPGENDHLASIVRPRVHVITSVALEHLEFMHTIEAIAAAEAEPIAHVDPDGAVVLPSDEPRLEAHRPRGDRPAVLRFGPDPEADVRITAVEQGVRTRVSLALRGEASFSLSLRAFGAHNARNAAAAIAVGHWLGRSRGTMVDALEALEPVGDRGRTLALGPHLLVADCYNANPGSVEVALRALASLRGERGGPLVAVIGDMLELGPRELELHAEVGRLAAELGLDLLVGIGARTRAAIETAARAGLATWHADDDVDAAAAVVRARLEGAPAGAVLVKGSRGMQLERVVDRLR